MIKHVHTFSCTSCKSRSSLYMASSPIRRQIAFVLVTNSFDVRHNYLDQCETNRINVSYRHTKKIHHNIVSVFLGQAKKQSYGALYLKTISRHCALVCASVFRVRHNITVVGLKNDVKKQILKMSVHLSYTLDAFVTHSFGT